MPVTKLEIASQALDAVARQVMAEREMNSVKGSFVTKLYLSQPDEVELKNAERDGGQMVEEMEKMRDEFRSHFGGRADMSLVGVPRLVVRSGKINVMVLCIFSLKERADEEVREFFQGHRFRE